MLTIILTAIMLTVIMLNMMLNVEVSIYALINPKTFYCIGSGANFIYILIQHFGKASFKIEIFANDIKFSKKPINKTSYDDKSSCETLADKKLKLL